MTTTHFRKWFWKWADALLMWLVVLVPFVWKTGWMGLFEMLGVFAIFVVCVKLQGPMDSPAKTKHRDACPTCGRSGWLCRAGGQ